MPSVRGWEKVKVVALLIGSTASSASLVGFAAGLLWQMTGLGPLSPRAAALLVAAAIGLDVVVRPLGLRQQVPQLWGRLLGAPTAAVLYGARLGVGPLTILATWLWWAAVLVGAGTGPWGGAAVGAMFGGSRVATMLVAGSRAGRWQGLQRRSAVAVGTIVVVAVGAVAWWPPTTSAPATQTGATVGRSVSTTTTTTTSEAASETIPEQADVVGRLPDDIGSDYRRVVDRPSSGLGPLDLAAAAALEDDAAAERSLLETRRFEAGHARAWEGRGRIAYAAVYRFASSADAEAYAVDGAITLEGRGVRPYPVDPPEAATGFSEASDDGSGSTVSHGIVFVRDRYFFLILLTVDSGGSAAAEEVRAIAVRVAAAGSR